MGIAIARHVATGGGEALTIRLDPGEMGRIEVRLTLDEHGTLRAVMAADNPASLDMLRRDSADLSRALSDAGVRADAQSLRFDTRSHGGGQNGQDSSGSSPWQRQHDARANGTDSEAAVIPAGDPAWRPLTLRGRVDLMA
jgi:flagellar hook-length control protein FliK